MLSYSLISTLFINSGEGGGKSESAVDVPDDYVTLNGETMTIGGEEVSIQGAVE